MQEKYPTQVQAISWNLDHDDPDIQTPAPLKQEVLEKLVELKLNCQNVIAADAIDDVLERHDIFGVPATLVYGRDGKLLKKFEGAFSYKQDVFPFVEMALKQSE